MVSRSDRAFLNRRAAQVRKFLLEHPDAGLREFTSITGIVVEFSLFRFVKDRMREGGELPSGGTKSAAVRLFLASNEQGTRAEFMAATGIEVNASHFSQLRGWFQAALKRHQKDTASKMKEADGPEERIEILETALGVEKRESAYLRWLLVGERKGYMDRALKELDPDDEQSQ